MGRESGSREKLTRLGAIKKKETEDKVRMLLLLLLSGAYEVRRNFRHMQNMERKWA